MGGFTSVAPIFAGRRYGALTFLHESNVIPGRANRWLAHVVAECFVGFPEAADRLWHPRVTHTGTPVRTQFEPGDPAACRMALGLDPLKPVLIIMGGSQGARGINDVVVRALPALAAALPDLQYFHLSGTADFDLVRTTYARTGRRALVRPFCSEMELLLGAATVVVSRAGASTLAELAAMRVPGILIPFPAATDDHQRHNAAALARNGAASLLTQNAATPDVLIQEIRRLVTNPVRREAMSVAIGKWHVPLAAEVIADRLFWLTTHFHRLPAAPAGAKAEAMSLRARPTQVA
jgi:UDP-N-acetylglucosamine--N-acetylmuramyl-(pentapeptide) pyrophosphoryl-undecaprenol N-acetylglucosamine transferase